MAHVFLILLISVPRDKSSGQTQGLAHNLADSDLE